MKGPQKKSSFSTEPLERIVSSIILDWSSPIPLHSQLTNFLRSLILESAVDGEKLPSEERIADLVGTSVGTVRRSLSDLTVENLVARRRATGSVVRKSNKLSALKNLAVITPDWPTSHVFSRFITSIYRHGQNRGTKIQVITVKKDSDWSQIHRAIEFSPREGGALFLDNNQTATQAFYKLLSQQGYRSVSLGGLIEGYPGSYVGTDNEAAVEMGFKFLYEAGHRKILFLVAEPEEFEDVKFRVKIFERLAGKFNLSEARVVHCGVRKWESPQDAAFEATSFIWKTKNRPTAIFCVSDATAFGSLLWLIRNNFELPRDVSLLSFDGTDLTRMVRPAISSLVEAIDPMIIKAFEILESENTDTQCALLSPTMQEASTTGPLLTQPFEK